MRVFADIRALQDPAYAGRGIGSHAAFLLDRLRDWAAGGVVGLVDPQLGPLAGEHAALCTELRPAFVCERIDEPVLFLALAPLTHDSLLPARLLDRPHVLPLAVVYDFIPLAFPDRYLAGRDPLLAYAAACKWLEAYRGFLPISAHCGAELVRRCAVPPDRVSVTGVALRDAYARLLDGGAPPARPPGAADETILFVGGGDPRKNLETVVAAHATLVREGRAALQLVVGGDYPPDWQERIRRESHKRCGRSAEIRFLDHVADDELAAWHAHARATVTASLAEGFSLPVIEAIASGGVAVVSDIPVHRELIDAPEALFAATDAAGLARTLGAILDSPALRARLRDRQQPVARRFTPAAVGARFVEALDRHGRSFRAARRVAARRRRPAIAFVTPYPPDRSGVADYSRQCVATLARYVDVDVYTDAPVEPEPAVRAFHPISAAAWLRPDYDAVVAVVGNSHFHTKIIDLQRRFGGPCIVHDNRLAEVTAWWKGDEHLRRLAERSLGRAVSAAEVQDWLAEPATLPTLFFDDAIEKAEPLFVHSAGLRSHVARLYGVDAEQLPFCVYRDFAATDISAAARRAARDALGMPHQRRVVVTLGIVDAVKSPATCIEALARVNARDAGCDLYFVGDCRTSVRGSLAALAASLGVAEHVHFTAGWTSEADYRRHVVAADAGIQLRTHYRGGLSGALTDCVAAGLPTVANADLAAAIAAPAFVERVPDRCHAGHVAAALLTCLARGRDRHEHERRAFASHHSFDGYARRLLTRLLGPAPAWALAPERPVALAALAPPIRRILVDATYSARTAGACGVQRVVTRTCQEIGRLAGPRGATALQVVARGGRFVAADTGAAVEPDDRDLLLLPDAYWACGSVWPAVERARAAGTTAATLVYDLIPLQHPDIYGAEGGAMFRRYLAAVVAHSDLIVTISETVARDLADVMPQFRFPRRCPPIVPWRLGCDLPAAGGGVRPGIRRLFTDRTPESPYLVVGAIEPRKNHELVLDAFARLWEDPETAHVRLAIAGRPGFRSESALRRIKSDPRFGERLFLLTDLGDDEIDHAYRHARAVVSASRAEGFGLPLVEAARHGQTVFASDLPIHREVGGDTCDYFRLAGPGPLADTIATHERRHRGRAAAGRAGVAPTTWTDAVAHLLDALGVQPVQAARPAAVRRIAA